MDYLSPEERSRLDEDLKRCIAHRRALAKRLGAARELGDLRENAEYHAAREDQGLNEARIRELEHRLAHAVVADEHVVPDGMVYIGATVLLRDVETGEEERYRLVGTTSGALEEDCIEVTPQSPLGEALIKSHVGETVRVALRRGPKRFEIVGIIG